MTNYSISKQIKDEIKDFNESKVILASKNQENDTIRYLDRVHDEGYSFNQAETLAIIDLFYNSKFENGAYDDQGERKIFLNISKFRTDVAAKQVDIDVKDFKFIPDDYASPFTALFMQKDFREWAKESYFGEIINQVVDAFPKYGTVVLKKVGRKVEFVPLQLLKNEQTAECLEDASYVIEEHPNMYPWELQEMKAWNLEGLDLRHDKPLMVYERYGYVPRWWLKEHADTVSEGDDDDYVDSMVIVTCEKTVDGKKKENEHIFFAKELKEGERPYQEAHWNKQHGRWLGIGVMEDLISNQQAKNIITNLKRRHLSWAAKKLFYTKNEIESAKNLVRDVDDGDIIDVGVNGELLQVDTGNHALAEFDSFSKDFDANADQKAFTYEVATGDALPSGTPFRLGVLLNEAVNSYFALKREKLGLFLKRAITEFLIPEFIKDMGNSERVIAYFHDEPGYKQIERAAMDYVRSEAINASLLSGEPVDVESISQVVGPYEAVQMLLFKIPAGFYKDVKYKFDLTVTGEEEDLKTKMETLTTIYQTMAQQGDPRANEVLERITALAGVPIATFGVPGSVKAPVTPAVNTQDATQPTPTLQ